MRHKRHAHICNGNGKLSVLNSDLENDADTASARAACLFLHLAMMHTHVHTRTERVYRVVCCAVCYAYACCTHAYVVRLSFCWLFNLGAPFFHISARCALGSFRFIVEQKYATTTTRVFAYIDCMADVFGCVVQMLLNLILNANAIDVIFFYIRLHVSFPFTRNTLYTKTDIFVYALH